MPARLTPNQSHHLELCCNAPKWSMDNDGWFEGADIGGSRTLQTLASKGYLERRDGYGSRGGYRPQYRVAAEGWTWYVKQANAWDKAGAEAYAAAMAVNVKPAQHERPRARGTIEEQHAKLHADVSTHTLTRAAWKNARTAKSTVRVVFDVESGSTPVPLGTFWKQSEEVVLYFTPDGVQKSAPSDCVAVIDVTVR